MPKKTKKFIDRKSAVTFHLVHRSLKDPLAEDESAPQHVLVPTPSDNKDKKKQLEEQQKFGVYYDDDYNYLQHLREVDNTMEWVQTETNDKPQPKIQLPSSVFASKVENKVEDLNKAFPSLPAVDADVVAAMEDDFDFSNPENELEDNFLDLANQEDHDYLSVIAEEEEEDDESEESFVDSEDGNEVEFPDDMQEETKVQSTYDILTSSVRNRNKNLRFIDAQCEKVLADWDISEDEDDDNQQFMSNEVLQKCCEEFLEGQPKVLLDQDRDIIDVTKRLAQQMGSLSDEEYEEIEIPVKEAWSCMSVNSTSTTCNQPKVIPVPRNLTKKLTSALLSKHNKKYSSESDDSDSLETESIASRVTSLSIRPKDETPEEKRERKRNLREFRYERRKEKKLNSLAFKKEYLKQVQIDHTKRLNAAGNKIL